MIGTETWFSSIQVIYIALGHAESAKLIMQKIFENSIFCSKSFGQKNAEKKKVIGERLNAT